MEISSLFPLEIPGNMTVLYKHWHSQLRLEKNSTRYVMKRLHKALGELLLKLPTCSSSFVPIISTIPVRFLH